MPPSLSGAFQMPPGLGIQQELSIIGTCCKGEVRHPVPGGELLLSVAGRVVHHQLRVQPDGAAIPGWVRRNLRLGIAGEFVDPNIRSLAGYVEHSNDVRLNSAIGYITPKDMLAGRQQEIHAERDRKLEEARKQRQIRRQQAA